MGLVYTEKEDRWIADLSLAAASGDVQGLHESVLRKQDEVWLARQNGYSRAHVRALVAQMATAQDLLELHSRAITESTKRNYLSI